MTRAALRPFFTFYGGKWRAAPHYPAPLYPTIVEPFAGSAGYSLRYPERAVVLIERDPLIAETWRYLLRVSPQEVLALPDVGPGEEAPFGLPEEARLLIRWWLNKGSAQPKRTMSRWLLDYPGSGLWGADVRRRIAGQLHAIRHWRLIEGDYWQVPNMAATWFVDPPYQTAGKHYRFGASGLDFAALGAWCRARQGQTIVCENVGADWLPFVPFRRIKASEARHGGKTSDEAIWLSSGCLGWRLAGDEAGLLPEPTERAAVDLARELRTAGLSLRAVAAELDRRGYHARNGHPFAATQIARMVT